VTPGLVTIVPVTLVDYLDVSGTIDAKRRAFLHFLTGGQLVEVPGLAGVAVKKDQLIAGLDQRSYQKQLEKSLTAYSAQRLTWDQQLDDIKDRTIDQRELRQVERQQLMLDNSVLDVEITSLGFDSHQITAPFDGMIVAAPVSNKNQVISPADVFEIADPTSLIMRALIDETDLKKINIGLPAELTFDAYDESEMTLTSHVDFISYKSVSTTGGAVYVVELPVAETDLSKFRLGMNGNAKIILATKENVIGVPLEALFTDASGENYVLLKDRNARAYLLNRDSNGMWQPKTGLIRQPVITGMETEEMVEIISGLQVGNEIAMVDW
jgi:RND family efflux transporter MFP subunit